MRAWCLLVAVLLELISIYVPVVGFPIRGFFQKALVQGCSVNKGDFRRALLRKKESLNRGKKKTSPITVNVAHQVSHRTRGFLGVHLVGMFVIGPGSN